MIRRPPRPTLFPSTPLSRSAADVLPAGTSFVSVTNGATYDAGTNTVGFGGASLGSGEHTALHQTLAHSVCHLLLEKSNNTSVSSAQYAVSANDSATQTAGAS